MATGRVRARFFHTRTQPAGQDPWPGLGPFRVLGFFPGLGPAPARPDLFFPTFKPIFIFAIQVTNSVTD